MFYNYLTKFYLYFIFGLAPVRANCILQSAYSMDKILSKGI